MLVLSRRPDEAIVLHTLGVRVRVLRVEGNIVRLGIEAPDDVRIRREELADKKDAREAGSRDAATPARPASGAKEAAGNFRRGLRRIGRGLRAAQQELRAGQSDKADEALARAQEALAALQQGKIELPASSTAGGRARAVRTLVVEDDGNERDLLSRILRLTGCACDVAVDGEAALEYLASHERPDFILLDMRMPRRDGASTLKEIRRDPRLNGLKIFAISGGTPQEFGVETGPGGVDAWFTKPVNPSQLFDAMRRSMENGTN
jgi:carbon storage regulator CsrA